MKAVMPMQLQAINDLRRHTSTHRADITAAILRVIDSGWFVLGPEVLAFEQEFAGYCGSANCVSLANGTDALEIALRALGVGAGKKVITVSNAGMYGTTAIMAAGAEPVFVDIDAMTLLIDEGCLLDALGTGPNAGAVIVTHLYGLVGNVDALVAAAHSAGVPVIEDCAQAHGACVDGRRAGTFGDIGCFSFYPTKNLGALGDGGAIVTNDDALAASVRKLRQYGWSEKYRSSVPGGRNSRLDEMQAAVLRVKLPRLDGWNRARRSIAARFSAEINNPKVACPRVPDENYVAHLYVIQAEDRDGLKAHLSARGVASDIHYPVPDFRQPAIAKFFPDVVNPVAEASCRKVLTLPCFPEMTDAEVSFVISAVNAW
jgi:dTDP-3-amino-2,3,6-trideoxy-4-keto-D-glucose/dTDP-3-amino-3,4,6-trideoxy-alpha-D-glucose/dTDP-2,6-dideoxy-D-kanosamine transaminase